MDAIHRMAVGYNFYVFLYRVLPNLPAKISIVHLNDAIIHFCNLTADSKNNDLSLKRILNKAETEIDETQVEKFRQFKTAVFNWLDAQSETINYAKTLRDKFITHKDIRDDDIKKTEDTMKNFLLPKMEKVANMVVEIYSFLLFTFGGVIMMIGEYRLDEYTLAYSLLKYLDENPRINPQKRRLINNMGRDLKEIEQINKQLEGR